MLTDPQTLPRSFAPWFVFLFGTLLALPFALCLALNSSLDVDEHQHIAAGVLLAREGLLPYRDFPYFHVPYLVYAYGLLFQFTDQYLYASRIFSASCAALTGGALFAVAWHLFPTRPPWQRVSIATAALALLSATPVYYDTAILSWNMAASVLLALLAFLCHDHALDRARPGPALLLSGLLLGLAIGIRVTVAPLVLPFAIWLFHGASTLRVRAQRLAFFSAGLALALLPLALIALAAPTGFWFGNIEFPSVNIEFRYATDTARRMTLPRKLEFAVFGFAPVNWMICYGFLAAWLAAWIRPTVQWRSGPRVIFFLLLTFPFLLLGALAPSPVFDQYFYPLAPFLIIGLLAFFASVPNGSRRLAWMWSAGAAVVLCSVWLAREQYADLRNLHHPQDWKLAKLHRLGREMQRLVPRGRVLTLAPTLPLLAGLQIYPEFATGPFAWRIAPLVSAERRPGLHIIAPEDLADRLAHDPPAALLLGFDARWEEPFVQYARTHGYRPVALASRRQLWLKRSGSEGDDASLK